MLHLVIAESPFLSIQMLMDSLISSRHAEEVFASRIEHNPIGFEL